ncbi:MAG TPA: FKBP-type peptidyl-prolyl cis-trans isomerase [Candidatus Limnocylindria bacterium]|nr:FKBP-type peptidyl-prolyl cis-trans isomerase [Candidatus Limnocylindria bacterium]
MKRNVASLLAFGLTVSALAQQPGAPRPLSLQPPRAGNTNVALIGAGKFKDDLEKRSYAIGVIMAANTKMSLQRGGFDASAEVIAKAFNEFLLSTNAVISEEDARAVMTAYSNEMRQKAEEKRKLEGETNKKAGEAFLAENKSKEGVVTTPSGLQYKVLSAGTGEKPKDTDTVSVNYKGTLINGTEFDSSYAKGKPAEFRVTGVIKGWTEGLQLMPVGSKYQFFIPSELAYGERGQGAKIGPNSALVFEVELLGIKAMPPIPTDPHAATSDIIKVPSQEEMKKGAKPEVIKAGDVEKYIKQGTNNPASKKPTE